jgi:predicted transcriptional regulator
MENFKSSDYRKDVKRSDLGTAYDELLRHLGTTEDKGLTLNKEEIVNRLLKERAKKASRRKWIGRILIVFGFITMVGSCPFYAISFLSSQSIMAGLAIMVAGLALISGGGVLLSWRSRLKDTNEAMVVALKHGNQLTTSRLALELDISFEKADRIIQELVRNGIAEIDLEHQDPDNTIMYKIKGL